MKKFIQLLLVVVFCASCALPEDVSDNEWTRMTCPQDYHFTEEYGIAYCEPVVTYEQYQESIRLKQEKEKLQLQEQEIEAETELNEADIPPRGSIIIIDGVPMSPCDAMQYLPPERQGEIPPHLCEE